ncbi:MAG: polysaccharide deacetylase family protein [Firmicutes bacterium]|nr:polysaccharide deacetylase family protein [Bacillota bacterium]
MLKSKLKKWVNSEVDKKLDQQRFSSLPLRVRIGIGLLISSYTIGYGVPIGLVIFSGINHELFSGMVKGSFVYGVCWVIGAIGLALAGRECIKYPIFFLAKLLKKIFPKYFEEEIQSQYQNSKTSILPSAFHFVTLLALVGVIVILIIALILSSDQILLWGIVPIIFLHQGIHIYGMFSSRSNYFLKTVKGKEFFHNKNGILFRFDDGPDPKYTPQILDILKSQGVHALFAITGVNAERYPQLVARIHRENHIIANHTYTHPLNILFFSYVKLKNEIVRTNQIIEDITGEKPKYFCPPMGFKNPIISKVTKELDLIPVMWDLKSWDTKCSYRKIVAGIMKKIKSPSIILFHDAIMPCSKKERDSTVLALKEIIRVLKQNKIDLYHYQ